MMSQPIDNTTPSGEEFVRGWLAQMWAGREDSDETETETESDGEHPSLFAG